jgi:lipid-A-disaccharide synthase
MMREILDECRRRRPQAVVLVDYPGFNLRFAQTLRRIPEHSRTPILYYVSPQVWAWHAARVPKIARLVDRMAVIFDFELPIYQSAGLPADFVGHPLLEVVRPTCGSAAFRREFNLPDGAPLLALAPGSRLQEVHRLFPLFLRTFALLKREFPDLKALVGCSPAVDIDVYAGIIEKEELNDRDLYLLQRRTYDVLAHCDVALVASGTVTLETAILGTPLVMAYKVAPLTYFLGRWLVKIPNLALVNVVAGKRVAPEFVQGNAQPRRLASELSAFLKNPDYRQETSRELARVREKLGDPGASARVAAILHAMIAPEG